MNYNKCNLCPRECNVDRNSKHGFCSSGSKAKIARASVHMWEEPCISGTRGSGTVFFSGCNMKCVYCQNEMISRGKIGVELSDSQLGELFLIIAESGVHNINLVTPSHFLPNIISAIKPIKDRISVPIVYNCSGYEKEDAIRSCQGIIDIFLTDIKYRSAVLSNKYSSCPDYFEAATKALKEMLEIAGMPVIKDGIMTSGVIVRHLVLPSHKNDSIDILKDLFHEFGNDRFLVSLMSQYTPMEACKEYPEINRRLTTMEYQRVCQVFAELGFDGYMQEKSSSSDTFIPDFNDGGEFLSALIR